ncbi:hypothetical protein ACP70R_044105 [Stipagrostis hirtigluma subsp. patula]
MASEGRVRRIVDYLNDGEELGIGTPPRSPAARSLLPGFRWPRVVKLGRKGAGGKGKGTEEVPAEKGKHAPVAVAVSTSVCQSAAAADTRHSELGLGLSLVFLLAKTSDEFNKMVKVRTEMEALLKEFKDQVRETSTSSGHAASKPRNLESTTSSCVTDRNDHDQSISARLEDQAASSGTELVSCDKSSEDDDCGVRMDVLEDEFHIELERLQVNYSSGTPSVQLEEEEEEEHYSEPSDEITDYRHGFNDELEEVVEDEDDDDGNYEAEYNGVSALELERRLHELLHERNRERIEELEAALRRAEKQLAEKEMEVCLWKDTAKFALRQNNELQ